MASNDALSHEDILGTVDAWLKNGKDVALATVVTTWGSSPRPVGSQLAVDQTGAMIGSVSGGCIEGAVVQEALAAIKDGNCAHAYFDLNDQIKANAGGYFPYTPSLPLLYGLREALDMLDEEGLDNVFARHAHLAGGVRAAVEAWGLKLCAKDPKWYSDTVSAVMVPAGFNGADVIDVAFRRYDLALGAGLSQVAGKLFRIGHLGDLNELMLLGAIAGAEMAMRDTGIEVELGSGVAAAQEHYRGAKQAKVKQVAAE
jgi:alanine-glyoxylate transaminase/serine-glyoxylate transaminase/serine-pyruvate transaminase